MVKKIISIILAGTIAVGSVFYYNRAKIVKNYVIDNIQSAMGVKVDIGRVIVNLPQGTITLHDVAFHNPKGFIDGNMMVFDSIMIDYNRDAVREGTIHINLLDMEIDKIVVIKNKKGEYNLDALNMETTVIPIDQFELSIKRVVYLDESKQGPGKLQVYDVNIKDQRYADLPGPEIVIDVIIKEALGKAILQGAAISGVLVLGGAMFWPVGVALVVVGKNTASAEFDIPADVAFASAKGTLEKAGRFSRVSEGKGILEITIKDYSFTIHIKSKGEGRCEVRVSARRFRLLPSLAAAKTGLYTISDGFKKIEKKP